MKKAGDKIYLADEEASLGFLCPESTVITEIPLCNVCKNWNGYRKCKKLGESPEAYSGWEKRDCPAAILDTETFGFPQFAELYPEDTQRLLKKQKEI